MPHHHDHNHGSSKRQLQAAALMFVFAVIELAVGLASVNPLLTGDALHNLADVFHLGISAGTDYIADHGKRHAITCRLPLIVGGVGFLAPAVIIGLIAIFEGHHLKDLSAGELSLTIALGLIGIAVNLLAHSLMSVDARATEASGRFHLLVDVYITAAIIMAALCVLAFDTAVPGQIALYGITGTLLVFAALEFQEQIKLSRDHCEHQLV